MHIIVIPIVAGIGIAIVADIVNDVLCIRVWRLLCIGKYGGLVHNAHQQALPQHYVVPFVNDRFNNVLTRKI